MKKILFLAIAITLFQQAEAQLFAVDFNKSSNVKDYQSNTPGIEQFNSIAATGASNNISVNNGKLHFNRTTDSDFSYFIRKALAATAPTIMMVKFDLNVSGNDSGIGQNVAAVFQLGDEFSEAINPVNNTTQEFNKNTHSRLGISLNKIEGQFFIRDYNYNKNSESFSGTQTITWIINNTGATITYTGPDKNPEILGTERSDVWVGNTKVINEQAGPGGFDKDLKDFKFSFLKGKGAISIGNLSITDISNLK